MAGEHIDVGGGLGEAAGEEAVELMEGLASAGFMPRNAPLGLLYHKIYSQRMQYPDRSFNARTRGASGKRKLKNWVA